MAPPSMKGLPATGCSIPSFHHAALHSARVLPNAEEPTGSMPGLGLRPAASAGDIATSTASAAVASDDFSAWAARFGFVVFTFWVPFEASVVSAPGWLPDGEVIGHIEHEVPEDGPLRGRSEADGVLARLERSQHQVDAVIHGRSIRAGGETHGRAIRNGDEVLPVVRGGGPIGSEVLNRNAVNRARQLVGLVNEWLDDRQGELLLLVRPGVVPQLGDVDPQRVDDGEKQGLARRNRAIAYNGSSTGAGQEPDRPLIAQAAKRSGRILHRVAVRACRVAIDPLPPGGGPLAVAHAVGRRADGQNAWVGIAPGGLGRRCCSQQGQSGRRQHNCESERGSHADVVTECLHGFLLSWLETRYARDLLDGPLLVGATERLGVHGIMRSAA